MPRDGAGNYTLPAGNPVVSGTVIESVWANSTMEDIATSLTNSLSRNGNGGMLAPLGFVDGSEVSPGMYFTAQVNMGLHRANVNDMRLVMGGQSILRLTDTFVDAVVGSLRVSGNEVITTAGGQTINGTLQADSFVATNEIGFDLDRSGVSGPASINIRNIEGGAQFRTDGGGFVIYQTDSSGAAQEPWIVGNLNGSVELYHNGSKKIQTDDNGITVGGRIRINEDIQIGLDIDRPGTGVAEITLRNDNAGARLRTKSVGGIDLYQISPSGTNEGSFLTSSKDAEVSLYYDGAEKLETTSSGINVSGAITSDASVAAGGQFRCTSDTNTLLDLDRPSTGVVDAYLRNDNGGVRLRSNSGSLEIDHVTEAGASPEKLALFSKNGSAFLYHNGVTKLQTTADGLQVDGEVTATGLFKSTSNTNTLLDLDRPSSGVVDAYLTNDVGGARMRLDTAGGFKIYQVDADQSNNELWMDCTRNGTVGLYWNASLRFNTNSTGAKVTGDFTATGSVTGGTSDERLKVIHDYYAPEYCLNAISTLDVINYSLNELAPHSIYSDSDVGLIAQQVEEWFPELTPLAPFDNENGESRSGEHYKTIRYDRLVSVLVGAIQELTSRIEELENA